MRGMKSADVTPVTYQLAKGKQNEANALIGEANAARAQGRPDLAGALRKQAQAIVDDEGNYKPSRIARRSTASRQPLRQRRCFRTVGQPRWLGHDFIVRQEPPLTREPCGVRVCGARPAFCTSTGPCDILSNLPLHRARIEPKDPASRIAG